MPCLRLDAGKLLAGPREIETALAWAHGHPGTGPVLIASSGNAATVQALQSRHGASMVGHAIEQTLADLAEALVQAGVRRLVVAGGETSGAVVDRLGIETFVVGESIAPGVSVLLGVGENHAGIGLAVKSGNFGGKEFFSEVLAAFDGVA